MLCATKNKQQILPYSKKLKWKCDSNFFLFLGLWIFAERILFLLFIHIYKPAPNAKYTLHYFIPEVIY